ncbi:unnamed protein product (macronuclear) [Paramecium tetraurelia]|uniref:Uncharacterized protein n=1 Tax=Paramecium tetraurelia TaxID=5888 RepID=A0BJ77_PARTE|nr:uncharacterized protein GSPATT00004967001 [Paramecium tetraurelia]CAK58594.1 unnamed protein product [Paramecium tetraurelia]|eukprot:XP_001425992.1 hypothetical protein (macronuclear) [Paramecium tetraurelia strain d4-2]
MNQSANYSKSKFEFDEIMQQIENDSPLQTVYRKNSFAIKNLNLYDSPEDEMEHTDYSAKSLSESQQNTQI